MRFGFVLLVSILSGCASFQTALNKEVQMVTVPDLTAALADATAANNSSGVTCWGGLLTYVNSLNTAGATTVAPKIVGAATLLELGSEAAQTPTKLISLPPLPRPVHDACAGVLQDDVNLLGKFGITAASITKATAVLAPKP